MSKEQVHYVICLERVWPSGSKSNVSVFYGTDPDKMKDALAIFEKTASGYKFNLDVDSNYDPDCGAFRTYESIYGESPATKEEKALQKAMKAVRKKYGEEGN